VELFHTRALLVKKTPPEVPQGAQNNSPKKKEKKRDTATLNGAWSIQYGKQARMRDPAFKRICGGAGRGNESLRFGRHGGVFNLGPLGTAGDV